MGFSVMLVIASLLVYVKLTSCESRATVAALICGNRSATNSDRQVFVSNFLATMDSVTPQIARQRYGQVVYGTGNNTVYTFGECMKDLSQIDCNLCFAQCKTQILRCLPFQRMTKGGRLFCDGCYIRYDDYWFFNESSSSVHRTVCGDGDFLGNQTLFRDNVNELVRNMRVDGPKNDGFFTGSVNKGNLTVYGLAQCWEPVKGNHCVSCLENSALNISSCPPKLEGRALNSGCYLRYSTQQFYNNSETNTSDGTAGRSNRRATIVASTCASVSFLLFVVMFTFLAKRKIQRKRTERKKLGALLSFVNKSQINFSYEDLERATNYFHSSNKLGQGGSGSVYKGILHGGKVVAVKRLLFNTSQWADHFFNEVNLISGIDHKNLVKLLGCSITGPESLLVYEYVRNQSLHYHLFDRKDSLPLGWEDRFRIILGIAEGLAFLHEESELRIIHRDIKLSNVLLDEDLTPKITDFGLARLFPDDKSHISTAIAGTLGYMAPEYVVRGKLTEKADVYSFGVLVIEVVCGKKNTISTYNSQSILQKVWNLYRVGKASEALDPSIKGNFPEVEASRLLQIGLLCVQASAELRPSMSTVVKLLTQVHEIPQPTQPPFLNSSNTELGSLSQPNSYTGSSGNEITESYLEPR